MRHEGTGIEEGQVDSSGGSLRGGGGRGGGSGRTCISEEGEVGGERMDAHRGCVGRDRIHFLLHDKIDLTESRGRFFMVSTLLVGGGGARHGENGMLSCELIVG